VVKWLDHQTKAAPFHVGPASAGLDAQLVRLKPGPQNPSEDPVKITAARVIVTCPGRNFVTLKIDADDGVYGIGDATLNGRELAVASYLGDHVIPMLIGRDPARIEDTWQYLYRGAYWRRGPMTMSAIAAVDTALWDIKGKVARLPVYELLGGRSRDGVMAYGHANGNDIAETVDEVARYIALGYKAIRAQCGIPGLASTYGVAKDKMYYERRSRRRTSGPRRSISIMCQSCSTRFARASVSIITCCTTFIIG
jgi:mannonate dehydratase